MGLRVTGDAVEFREWAFPFLARDPVLNTVILTNVVRLAGDREPSESDNAVFVAVEDDGDIVGAVMRTPGRPVYLGALDPAFASDAADVYAEHVPDLAGVTGIPAAATAFARRWNAVHGTTATQAMATRLHRLEELVRLPAYGVPRRATPADVELAAAWVADDFGDDIGDLVAWARGKVADDCLWFWEADGTPVSMVGHQPPVFGVCRVGPVYTPPEHRRNGYAGALTSHVSAEILARGERACLYTDLANPTSNKIYREAGYRPVTDFVELAFAS